LVIHRRECEQENEPQKRWDRTLGAPVHAFEARILHMAEHHEGEKNQKWWQCVFPRPDGAVIRLQPEHEEGEGSNETCGGGYGETVKILVRFVCIGGGDTVKSRQTERAAEQEEESNEPAGSLKISEDDLVNKKRRSDAEGNGVGE
jgi:hypothetical protein